MRRSPSKPPKRGTGFPIRFGDAFVYALAKARNLPILTLDAEFAKTDAALVPLA